MTVTTWIRRPARVVFLVVLTVAGSLGVPSAAGARSISAAGVRVSVSSAVAGSMLQVKVVPRARVTRAPLVRVVRVSASGRPMLVVAERRIRRGTVSVRLGQQVGADYAVQVKSPASESKQMTVEAQAPLQLIPIAPEVTTAKPGDRLAYTVRNNGDFDVELGSAPGWYTLAPDGWVPFPHVVSTMSNQLGAHSDYTASIWVPEGLPAGRAKFVWSATRLPRGGIGDPPAPTVDVSGPELTIVP